MARSTLMTQTHTAGPPSITMLLALIPKPANLEIALTSVNPSEALTGEGQRPNKLRAVSSTGNFHDLPGSWIRGGINE